MDLKYEPASVPQHIWAYDTTLPRWHKEVHVRCPPRLREGKREVGIGEGGDRANGQDQSSDIRFLALVHRPGGNPWAN